MKKSKWLVALMLMTVVLVFAGCSTPQEVVVEEAVVEEPVTEEVTKEEVIPVVAETVDEAEEAAEEPVVVEEAMATVDEEVILGMLSPDAALVKDEIAPDFALKNLDGEVVQLSDYRGKLVLLNFWTTW